MSNLQIKISSDLAPLEQVLSKLENSQVLYKSWANHLEGVTVKAFKSQSAPYGGKWAPLKPATVKQKKKRKNQILRETGTLYSTIAAQATPTGAVVGTNQQVGAYSLGAIHCFGAPKRNIPARPFLPIDAQGNALPQVIVELQEITEEFFAL
ncbi:phage virion morphogenesis protein [Leptolyngbyaceae cyanobacterium UHCC 1019]